MERLTYDFCIAGNHCWQVKGADNLECGEVCKSRDDEGCNGCPIANAFDRLAAIEDILGNDYDLERLRELVQADKNGRCVVLPCKCGDTINAFRWSNEKGTTIVSDVVTSVTTNRNGWTVKTKSKFYPIKQKDEYDFAPITEYPYALADFYVGSREAAEAALKAQKG